MHILKRLRDWRRGIRRAGATNDNLTPFGQRHADMKRGLLLPERHKPRSGETIVLVNQVFGLTESGKPDNL